MGGKSRVHELAKELGVPSKQLLAELREAGEAVKSASSTIEAPVARRLRAAHGDGAQTTRPKAQTLSRREIRPNAGKKKKPARRREPTPAQIATICERYRAAVVSASPKQSVDQLYRDCEAKYGLSRKRIKAIVAADARQHPQNYLPLQIQRRRSVSAEPTKTRPTSATLQVSELAPVRAAAGQTLTISPRNRSSGLPQITASMAVSAIATIITESTNESVNTVMTRLQEIVPTQPDDYGYLFWRYALTSRSIQPGSARTKAARDLAVLADLVDIDKHLIRSLEQAHGSIFEEPTLAKHALDARFDQLIGDDEDLGGLGDLASTQSRRASARFEFLRRAIVLAIACPTNDEALWNMLARLGARPLTGTAPEVRSANQRLGEFTSLIERLLTTDDDALNRFFHRSRVELMALREGSYDFLIPFRGQMTARRVPAKLAFEVLPPGEQTRQFLDDIRRSGRYFGHHVDERRLDVLEQLQKHFTPGRCRLHKGSMTSSGVDNRYLVLAIKSADGRSEDAVAISPLAGLHATYVVRRDCADADWPVVFAGSKRQARRRGARKLLFIGNGAVNPYNAMRDKVINLLECKRANFPQRHR